MEVISHNQRIQAEIDYFQQLDRFRGDKEAFLNAAEAFKDYEMANQMHNDGISINRAMPIMNNDKSASPLTSLNASLDAFQKKYSGRIRERYLVYTKDLAKEQDVLMLPVYMTMFL